jgi:hypothetical protein
MSIITSGYGGSEAVNGDVYDTSLLTEYEEVVIDINEEDVIVIIEEESVIVNVEC